MMNKLYAVLFVVLFLGFFSCGTTGGTASQNAESNLALDWDGVYTGIVPGADSAISVEIALEKDAAYRVSYRYIDKSDDVFTYAGKFTWKDSDTIELDDNEIPPYYVVGKNTLTQLDMAGEIITGEHSDAYILKKE